MVKREKWRDGLLDELKNPDFTSEYLEAALEEGDPRLLLRAIRDVAEASGGMSELARKTHMSRTTLYKTLSGRVSPRITTVNKILNAFGSRLAVERV